MEQAIDNDTITLGALSVRFLIETADSCGAASVFECTVPAEARMPAPHSHDGFEETIYGLEGVTTWTIDGETVEVGAAGAVAPCAHAGCPCSPAPSVPSRCSARSRCGRGRAPLLSPPSAPQSLTPRAYLT
jgi:hypothetical protein